jgi:hypothetical protein
MLFFVKAEGTQEFSFKLQLQKLLVNEKIFKKFAILKPCGHSLPSK